MLKPKFFIQKKRCEYNSEENRIIYLNFREKMPTLTILKNQSKIVSIKTFAEKNRKFKHSRSH